MGDMRVTLGQTREAVSDLADNMEALGPLRLEALDDRGDRPWRRGRGSPAGNGRWDGIAIALFLDREALQQAAQP